MFVHDFGNAEVILTQIAKPVCIRVNMLADLFSVSLLVLWGVGGVGIEKLAILLSHEVGDIGVLKKSIRLTVDLRKRSIYLSKAKFNVKARSKAQNNKKHYSNKTK